MTPEQALLLILAADLVIACLAAIIYASNWFWRKARPDPRLSLELEVLRRASREGRRYGMERAIRASQKRRGIYSDPY